MKETSRKADKGEMTFEKAFQRLEEIVGLLEKGNLPLEESLKLFEEGTRLSHVCRAKLDEAERKIEILTRDEGGNLSKVPFEEVGSDEGEEDA